MKTESSKNKKIEKNTIIASIIIPTLNEEKFIKNTLSFLKKQSVPRENYELIVSDSSSDDNTVREARKHADVVVVCKRQSAGYGRNFGAKKAKGKYLGFVDADTIVSRTWVEGLIETLEKKSVVSCTGPLENIEKDSLKINVFYKVWNTQTKISALFGYPIVPGFNFGVRKKEFDDVKGFPEKNMVCEDMDLSLRLSKKGKIAFSKKMGVKTSARRQKEMSIFKHIMSGVKYSLAKKSMTWNEYRKDF